MNSKMLGVVATSTPIVLSSTTKSSTKNSNPRLCFAERFPTNPSLLLNRTHTFSLLSIYFSLQKNTRFHTQFSPKSASSSSSSVGSAEYLEEPATKVKFQTSLSHPGCTSPLSLLGTGYREKVFAIIGVKVYAAGLYVNKSVLSRLNTWKGRLAAEIQADPALFDTVFLAPEEKSLHIVLVRDVDGKTFWDALDEAISPRIKSPTRIDESALSTFRSIFEGRSLSKGTSIFLTWLDPGKMLICVSSDGSPSSVDATIDSRSVTSALFDVFFGGFLKKARQYSFKDSVKICILKMYLNSIFNCISFMCHNTFNSACC